MDDDALDRRREELAARIHARSEQDGGVFPAFLNIVTEELIKIQDRQDGLERAIYGRLRD